MAARGSNRHGSGDSAFWNTFSLTDSIALDSAQIVDADTVQLLVY
ncbi:hypothetical protein RIB2604_02005890 [Aspergillus luchuensis]|uniref:Uncharacterized protein n=1 Tax=Aspergillus kawachii TaxID=1069201 RepID=A0A146FKN6_ASPKA|nr:hypothetical protein RIB2604_02005890 [Aspergillus luchuensis]